MKAEAGITKPGYAKATADKAKAPNRSSSSGFEA